MIDQAGPVLIQHLAELGWKKVRHQIIPDDLWVIQDTLCIWADSGEVDLILTSGGTGFSSRDVTPEATRAAIQKEAPGLAEKMRAESLMKTPYAALSRAVCGIRGNCLIVNLPGNPRAVAENLRLISGLVPHALHLLRDEKYEVERDHHSHP